MLSPTVPSSSSRIRCQSAQSAALTSPSPRRSSSRSTRTIRRRRRPRSPTTACSTSIERRGLPPAGGLGGHHDGDGLPEGLLHGNLLHAPDHAILSEQGPVAINWKASGRGPRLADFAYLIWGTGSWNPRRPNQERIDAAVNAYRQHIEPTADELERLEAVMYVRTLYLACFGYRHAVTDGVKFREWWFIRPPEYFSETAAATRAAFRR